MACWCSLLCLTITACPAHGMANETLPGPRRIVTLVTGECLVAEWLPGNSKELRFRTRDFGVISIDRRWVQRVENPRGVVDLGIHAQVKVAAQRPWSTKFLTPVDAGVCEVWSRFPAEVGENSSLSIQLTSTEGVDFSTTILRDAAGIVTIAASEPANVSYRQSLRWSSDKQSMVLTWGAGNWSVLLGDELLARGSGPQFAVQQVMISSDFEVLLPQVLLRSTGQPAGTRHAWDPSRDALRLNDGSVLYGEYGGHDVAGIQWFATGSAAITIPWTEFNAIELRRRDLGKPISNCGQPVTGSITAWRRSERTIPYPIPHQQWLGARTGTGAIVHPLLGSLPGIFDPETISRTQFTGTFQWLCPELVHLGDEREETWPVVLPLATTLAGEWNVELQPTDEVWIAADFSELEPCGSATPPDEPFLPELQRGELLTTLWVNDQLVGTWNRELSWRPPVASPQRIRLKVPQSLLKSGRNHWEIRQIPARNTGHVDDLLMSRLALEIVAAPAH